MKKIFSFICTLSLLVCSVSAIPVNAAELESPCTETTEEPSAGLISMCSLTASNYNGSLRVDAITKVSSIMQEIGLKQLIVQYSYDNSDWHDEWNAGDFLVYNTDEHDFCYIISLARSNCYYRVKCKHYAKKATYNTQSEPNTSNSVWIS